MSMSERAKLISKALGFFLPYLGRVIIQRATAVLHRWTWYDTPDAKNVVVLGGSFAGTELVNQLAHALPTGFKVVWIEKNSHLNYSFNFPRFSVMTGHEHTAFIPYDGRLQDYTLKTLQDELKIRVLLNERPKMPAGGKMARAATLTFSDSHEETFDLIIGCTGQRPNSSVLASLLPGAISDSTSRIIVRSTLQVLSTDDPSFEAPIFAFGDVADHGGPRMARAGWLQAGVVLDNILAMIQGQKPSQTYKPNVFIEGAIKLTLGKMHQVIYSMDADGSDVMFPSRNGRLDLEIERAWREFGADFENNGGPVVESVGEAISSSAKEK